MGGYSQFSQTHKENVCRTLLPQTVGSATSRRGKELADVAEEVMNIARTPWVDEVCEAAWPRLA
jgi:hypothetical protein